MEAVKNNVTARQVADRYEVTVSENGRTRCLFHNDLGQAMRIEKGYFCPYCKASGDAIDLAAFILGESKGSAARILAAEFSVFYEKMHAKKESRKNVGDHTDDKCRSSMPREGNEQDLPSWVDGNKIMEVEFCQDFLLKHPMKCINDRLYDADGMVKEDRIRNEVYSRISPYSPNNVARLVSSLVTAIKLASYAEDSPPDPSIIRLKNGMYKVSDRSFTGEHDICMQRLPVCYNPDAAEPKRWLAFLDDLIHPEDIPVLQEFIGYTLVATNRAQAMLLIIGNGGEGKSQIRNVLTQLLGDCMNTGSIQKLTENRFAAADLEGKLLLVDDDMNMSALKDTGQLKTIITLEGKTELERKGKQSVQGYLYARLLALGNGSLSALYDRSEGFYRRQLIIRVKEKPDSRTDDTGLSEKLKAEAEGILLWAMVGLHRLVENGYIFSVGQRMRRVMKEIQETDNNIYDFVHRSGCIHFETGTHATSRRIIDAYRQWCTENGERPLADNNIIGYLKSHAEKLGICYEPHLKCAGMNRPRGFMGMNVEVRTDTGMLVKSEY